MNKLFLAMTAIPALAIAAPATAQSQGYGYGNANANANMGFDNRIMQLDSRLQAGVQQGSITQAEARPLRQQLRQLARLERQYSRDGLTQLERQDLQQRIRSVRQQLRMADNGRNWNDDNYGVGGPYEEEEVQSCERRGGIGGLFDSVLGGRDDCGLRVGQRASNNLYAVPYQYRNQFRDGNGVYYRSDGQQIYQIDVRTNTVVRAYPMTR